MRLIRKLWTDDCGSGLVSAELLFLATILVLGLITGWMSLKEAINNEYEELANAYAALSQAYSFGGQRGCCAETAGSAASDTCDRVLDIICTPVTPCVADSELCPGGVTIPDNGLQ
jgi:hypothetical protein